MAHVVFWLVALIAAALTGPVGFTIIIAAWVGFLVEAIRFNRWCRRWANGWRPRAGTKVGRKQTLAYLVLALIGSVLGGWPGFALVGSAWVGMMLYGVVLGVTLAQREQEAARAAAPMTTAELRAKMDATVQRARAAKAVATTCAEPAPSNVPARVVEHRNVSSDLLERQTAAQHQYMNDVVEHEKAGAPPGISVLKSGVVDGMGYTIYTDGSIEAKLPQGMVRFGSVTELRAYLGVAQPLADPVDSSHCDNVIFGIEAPRMDLMPCRVALAVPWRTEAVKAANDQATLVNRSRSPRQVF